MGGVFQSTRHRAGFRIPLGEESIMIILTCSDERVAIMLPSGNRLIVDYCGEGEADRVMVHSVDSGDGDSPMNLDLVVPDPDSMCTGIQDEDDVYDVHRVCVRHHGPADGGRAAVPLEFTEEQDYQEE